MTTEPTFAPGDYVAILTRLERNGGRTVEHGRFIGRLVSVADDGKVEVERWAMARITRRTKAFGQRIDHSPYRVRYVERGHVDDLRPLHPTRLATLAADQEAILRYPTYEQRRYRREKARKEKEAR